MIHKLKYDGGRVDDSMDAFIYQVVVETDGQNAEVVDVLPYGIGGEGEYEESNVLFELEPSTLESYDWEPNVEFVKNQVVEAIEHMKEYLQENNLTFEEDFKIWEKESDESGVSVIREYLE